MKLKTQKHSFRDESGNDFTFSYQVNVGAEGDFTTTLPPETVKKLSELGINLRKNRAGREGFISKSSLQELTKQVGEYVTEATSRELVGEMVMIEYDINTRCSYGIRGDGEFVPNLSYDWVGREELSWKNGTQETHAASSAAYGIDVYARLVITRTYKYRSGATKEESESIHYAPKHISKFYEKDYAFQYLKGLTAMRPVDRRRIKVVNYDPDFAGMLTSMIKSICEINEKIKYIIEDQDKLLEHARSGHKLIGK